MGLAVLSVVVAGLLASLWGLLLHQWEAGVYVFALLLGVTFRADFRPLRVWPKLSILSGLSVALAGVWSLVERLVFHR